MTIYVYNLHINGIKIYMLFYKLFFSNNMPKRFFKIVYRQIHTHTHAQNLKSHVVIYCVGFFIVYLTSFLLISN